jgi:hypothetical protein
VCPLVVPDPYLSCVVLARISKAGLVTSIQSVQVLQEVIRHVKNQHPDVHPLVELTADMTIVRKPDWRSLLDTSFANLFSVKPATDGAHGRPPGDLVQCSFVSELVETARDALPRPRAHRSVSETIMGTR